MIEGVFRAGDAVNSDHSSSVGMLHLVFSKLSHWYNSCWGSGVQAYGMWFLKGFLWYIVLSHQDYDSRLSRKVTKLK